MKKKYKTFHRTFSGHTDIERHSTFIVRDKRDKRDEFSNQHDRQANDWLDGTNHDQGAANPLAAPVLI